MEGRMTGTGYSHDWLGSLERSLQQAQKKMMGESMGEGGSRTGMTAAIQGQFFWGQSSGKSWTVGSGSSGCGLGKQLS